MKNKKENKGKRRRKQNKESNKRKPNEHKRKGNNIIRNNRKYKVYQEKQIKHKIIKSKKIYITEENHNVRIKHKVRNYNHAKQINKI